MDKLTPERRSANMRAIRSKSTKPEMLVRRLVHSLGYRYRLHRKDLPGKPDLVFAGKRKVLFVHGCFWHQHPDCREGRIPRTRQDYWVPKLAANVRRDRQHQEALTTAGWEVLTVWECETRDIATLTQRLQDFLAS
ncbi:very short patch repair endonuclease [Novosphingobium beihaiensis]|uniref:Very short patch repair endonuclease n=1 Tax=Novosphingobium beihaiensis TaxID=2930389 RepID=A0ABT0BSN8_9SPHN|nr:DNA mismatch endonuclease Vsr [Novosphingobium beihaiensis]MCJ2188082.1 DNA mismatch endonuclease Vsr [Novosphingobium beihaiensis]